jgi:predicted small integral membrane protein
MSNPDNSPLASAHHEEEDTPAVSSPKVGFLPIETNWFDRLFISVVIWVALSLFWFRFVEPLGLSILISNAIALALAVLIITKG